jgi:hypothetical protein
MAMLPRFTLWLAGLGFLGFGIACLVAPLQVLGAAGVVLSGPIAATEVRAFYGGLQLGLAFCLLLSALRPAYRRAGLLLCLAAYGGIGVARALGMALDDVSSTFLWFALAVELGLAGLAAFCLNRLGRGT